MKYEVIERGVCPVGGLIALPLMVSVLKVKGRKSPVQVIGVFKDNKWQLHSVGTPYKGRLGSKLQLELADWLRQQPSPTAQQQGKEE